MSETTSTNDVAPAVDSSSPPTFYADKGVFIIYRQPWMTDDQWQRVKDEVTAFWLESLDEIRSAR